MNDTSNLKYRVYLMIPILFEDLQGTEGQCLDVALIKFKERLKESMPKLFTIQIRELQDS